MAHVLIIDDNPTQSKQIHELMQQKGFRSTVTPNLREAMEYSRREDVDVVLMDSLVLKGKNGTGLQQLHRAPSAPEIIIMSERANADEAEIAIKQGAWDYIVKTGSPQALMQPLTKVLSFRQKKQQTADKNPQHFKASGIIGNSARLNACLTTLAQAAKSEANVLISGETGTGKELFATALHENSSRKGKNFVVVDCAALPETLVESTLFGHEKGAFTGATQKQSGLIKQADGGTLFLDEVGELPLSVQKAFLRVLQERCFRPVGSNSEACSNFRLVAATNQDLDAMVKKGTFREDLLYRLRAFSIGLPSLRSRPGDITPLVKYYISQRQRTNALLNKQVSNDFYAALKKYNWPGNVRELFHALERSLAAASEHTTLYPFHLPTHIRVEITKASLPKAASGNVPPPERQEHDTPDEDAPAVYHAINSRMSLQQVRDQVLSKAEEIYLRELLLLTGGNIAKAIKISGLSRSRFYQLLKDHNIRPAAAAVT